MPLRIVIDTGVFLSQMNPDPTGGSLWDEMRAGRIVPLISAATLAEFQRKLADPRFNLPGHRSAVIIAEYASMAEAVEDVPDLGGGGCRDPKDWPFVDLALYAGCDALVSHDYDLLDKNGEWAFPVIRVSELSAMLRDSS